MTISAARLVRQARRAAGLTQAQLAERMGTTQSAVARLESPDANPRVENLERALVAAGHGLELRAVPQQQPVDETSIAENLKRTPEQRLAAMTAHNHAIRRLKETVKANG